MHTHPAKASTLGLWARALDSAARSFGCVSLSKVHEVQSRATPFPDGSFAPSNQVPLVLLVGSLFLFRSSYVICLESLHSIQALNMVSYG